MSKENLLRNSFWFHSGPPKEKGIAKQVETDIWQIGKWKKSGVSQCRLQGMG
jgi:hypothetical protein